MATRHSAHSPGNGSAAVVKKLYTLKAETELRCEVGEGEVLVVRLVNGTCEVFGIELVANREYI